MVDPISDMLTQIRNAQAVEKGTVTLSYSKLKANLAKILKKEGLIKEVAEAKVKKGKGALRHRFIEISLKYTDGKPAINELKRVSKPGQRIYVSYHRLPRVLNDLGIAVISTSQGLMTNKEARKKKLGGEVICEIW